MKTRLDLGGVWEWAPAGESLFRRGNVPGSLLRDMLAEGLISDPFWRTNEYETRELLANDFLYRRAFTVPESVLEEGTVELVCEGLDTLAVISINGSELAKTDNMHRVYRIPVKDVLRAGENIITVFFSSALRFAREEDTANDIHYASTGCIRGNAALRKAHYMFGWDWGPQLPDMGIFRDIYLEQVSGAVLDDVYIRQFHDGKTGCVTVSVTPSVVCAGARSDAAPEDAEIIVELTAPDGKTESARAPYRDGTPLQIAVAEPKLWWPNNLGEQNLYTVSTRLLTNGRETDRHSCRIGLRTITVSTDPDEYGAEFAITVNGIRIFACGANYIPQDSIIPRVGPAEYRKLIAESAEANFNCIRVWGGGYYPDQAFYDACDEYGILVWQDFMFACNVYALTDSFEQTVTAEIRDAVRAGRHHACLALWCGNNEMEWGWGEEWARIKGHHPRYKADYLKIFEMIIPRTLRKYDDQTYFWPSSPSSGGAYDYPNDPNRGDQHYWEVWHSGKPFTEYRNFHFRFCSEYGFQSFPHIKTIEQFTLPQDRNIFSEVMESHQKNPGANEKILNYISQYFLYPKDTDSLAFVSQILQLKAIQYGVEHWRRNRGRCMGSLYWQLNDCWPVASWASIDYYGRWKALHYGAKRFYAPLTASACEKQELDTTVSYYVHNDGKAACSCTLEIRLLDTSFTELFMERRDITVGPFTVINATTVDFSAHIRDNAHRRQVYAVYTLYCEGRAVSSGTTLFVKPKHFNYPSPRYTVSMEDAGDFYELYIGSDGFAQYVELYFKNADAVLSDNYFDITGSAPVRVRCDKKRLSGDPGSGELLKNLVVRSIADTYLKNAP